MKKSASSKVFFLASLFIILDATTSLKCLHCNINCENPQELQCLEPGEDQQTACLIESFKPEKSDVILQQRKCVLFARNKTRYECIDYPQYESIKCETCNTDRCNGGMNEALEIVPLGEKTQFLSINNKTQANNKTQSLRVNNNL